MKTPKALLILAALATAAANYADKVPLAELPLNIQQVIRSRLGQTQIEKVDRNVGNGQVTYQATWKENGVQQELVVSQSGTVLRDAVALAPAARPQSFVLANRVGVALTDAPPVVQAAIQNQILNAPIDGIQRGIANGRAIYEITYHDNGRLKTFQITDTGEPVADERPDVNWLPRYSNMADRNVPLLSGAKMAFNSAPRAVQTTVQHMANGARIEDFQRGDWNGRAIYQAAFKRDGQNIELQVFDDGTIVTKAPPDAIVAPVIGGFPVTAAVPGTPGGLPAPAQPSPATEFATEPRYAGLSDANVPLVPGSQISFGEAPRPVQTTIQQMSNGARIGGFERGFWAGQVVYQASFRRDGQNIHVQVLEDGSILTKPPGPAIGAPPATAIATTPE